MVVAAVDRSSVFKHVWFDELKMFAKDGLIKPFARGRDGFTLGDGGAAMVLESAASAARRKARVYAEYAGGSFTLEGWKVTYPDISSDRYEKMISKAIASAGLDPKDIDLVVPHGIGTTVTDEYEARAIAGIFGIKSERPFVTALKPYIGHTLGSAAMLETVIMLMAMEKGTVPATLNSTQPDDRLPVSMLRTAASGAAIKASLKTACGFAGFDGACVFKKYAS
jgi:3-oxoacyl-[acyl-carrier-protein] synthase II